MVQRDFDKSFWSCLDVIDYDVILVDFVDDRFDLVTFAEGFILTNSSEFKSAKFHLVDHGNIPAFSDAFFDIWLSGWEKLKSRLSAIGKIDSLLINKVYFAQKDDQGISFENTRFIDDGNKWLSRVYKKLSHDIPDNQFIDYGFVDFVGQAAHRWGRSPFHYVIEVERICLYSVKQRQRSIMEKLTDKSKLTFHPVMTSHVRICSSDYGRWNRTVFDISSIADFLLQVEFPDGIYRVPSGEGTLDVLIEGLHGAVMRGENTCLVCFSGALTSRPATMRPPFFSGFGVAKSAKLPLISISDPSLALDEKLSLAWYAGNSSERGLVAIIASILNAVAEAYELRLILIGGSGGGFAALSQECLLRCPATLIVWNPQTSIGEYVPDAVLKYLKAAFPELANDAEAALALSRQEQKLRAKELLQRTGVFHSLIDTPRAASVNVLYLQNRHDWHVSSHARPYLDISNWQRIGPNSFRKGEGLALHIGNWGADHTSPPAELVSRLVTQAAGGDTVVDIASELAAFANPDEYCQFFDADLPGEIEKPLINVVKFDGRMHIRVEMPLLPSSEQLEYALYYFINGEKTIVWYQQSPDFEIPHEETDLDAVQVFVRDFWKEIRSAYFRFPLQVLESKGGG